MLVGGVLYPFTSQCGGIAGKIDTWVPFVEMEMGNGLVAIMLVARWYQGQKNGVTVYDMGGSFEKGKTKIDWCMIEKTAILGAILFLKMYLVQGFFLYLIPALLFFCQARQKGYGTPGTTQRMW